MNRDEEPKLQDPPRIDNELVVDHMLQALYHLQMAYNAASNSNHSASWGIAIAIAETNGQAESMGIVPRRLIKK